MERTKIMQDGDYIIWREIGISEDAVAFLDSIAFGTEGAVYEHKNTAERMQHLHNPSLVCLREHGRLLGTAVLCNAELNTVGKTFNSEYLRYFAASPEIRGKGLVKRITHAGMEIVRDMREDKVVFFAAIESGNKRSYKIVSTAGYYNIGTVKTVGFSRYFPKKDSRIEQINTPEGREEVLNILKKQYSQHALVQFNSLFIDDNYYVIRHEGEIVAGMQYHHVHWVINNMPGFSGKIIMNVLPYVPVLNRLFNPKRFEFLAFEGFILKEGHEKDLAKLMEGLLAKEDRKTALMWMAEACPYYQTIKSHINLGIINNFVNDSDVLTMASFRNMTKEEEQLFEDHPVYTSAFDFI